MISSYIFIVFAIVLTCLLPFGVDRTETTKQIYYENKTVDSRDELPLTITADNVDVWGNVPGAFNSSFTTDIEITTYEPFDRRTGSMVTATGLKVYSMDTVKDVVPLMWINDTVQYSQAYSYNWTENSTENLTVLNYPALSLHY